MGKLSSFSFLAFVSPFSAPPALFPPPTGLPEEDRLTGPVLVLAETLV